MANFFIDRPIFAWVLAIITMLAGVLSFTRLPQSQYPEIAPPSVQIRAVYPGASAQTLENSVTQVIEQSMTGLDGLRYFSSTSSSNGQTTISLTFEQGVDPDIAQVQVQNQLQSAIPLLPQIVQQQGVNVSKGSGGFLMVVGFISEDGRLNFTDLGDFIASSIQEPLSRVRGVGSVTPFASSYSMRIWLDPHKLQGYKLTPTDVQAAIVAQNTQMIAGQIGGNPTIEGQQINATVIAQGRLESVQEFENIVLRMRPDGSSLRIKDVARVEVGSANYNFNTRFNQAPKPGTEPTPGKSAAALAISLATGANALETADLVRAELDRLSPTFPQGVSVIYPYDTTPFVKLSIESVIRTIIEAIVLVFVFMYLFMQNIRATLIPTIAVPIVLLGTLAVWVLFDFGINTLTMFGLVLSIGLLVDDAIVVVENAERIMKEEGLDAKEATRKSMQQISSPLIGIAIVVSMVFMPMVFFGGSTGIIYQQFSVTIIASMVLSLLTALILTPALCAALLQHHTIDPLDKKGFFGWFNRFFDRMTNSYTRKVEQLLHRSFLSMMLYIGLMVSLAFVFMRIPTTFLPDEDQGFLFSMVFLPSGASSERTDKVLADVEHMFLKNPHVKSVFTVNGFSFNGSGSNTGIAFVQLKDWNTRLGNGGSIDEVIGSVAPGLGLYQDALIIPIKPPAIIELSNATGFQFILRDTQGLGYEALVAAQQQLIGAANTSGVVAGARSSGLEDSTQYNLKIDFEKAQAMGINVQDITQTLATAWGGLYVNDYIDRGRIKRVNLQADAPFRMQPEDINLWHVRNSQNEMVPLSSFSSGAWTQGPSLLKRYNGLPALGIDGGTMPGVSTGTAMNKMEELFATTLGPGFDYQWTGLSYEEQLAGNQTLMLYSLSLLIVFLCLAALYESWSIPTAIMLIVPLGILGAVMATAARFLSNDVYFQVGLITTIGLAAKNAILIVEFAKEQYESGKDLVESAVEACRLRLRPIVMTSLTFVVGVMPLAIATGAGSASQNAIGTAVAGGMTAATVLAIFYVPLFYVLIVKLSEKKSRTASAPQGKENA